MKKVLAYLLVFLLGAASGYMLKDFASGYIQEHKEITETSKVAKKGYGLDEVISFSDHDLIVSKREVVADKYDGKMHVVFDVKITSKDNEFVYYSQFQAIDANEKGLKHVRLINDDIGRHIYDSLGVNLVDGQNATGYVAFPESIDKLEYIDGKTKRKTTIMLRSEE